MNRLVFLLVAILTIHSCNSDKRTKVSVELSNRLDYSTTSDSAIYYYELGWQQIMDEGFYGPSELSYRKSLEYDPDFLLSAGTLARLTLDLDERKSLLQKILNEKNKLDGDEALVLAVYQSFIALTNARQEDDPKVDSIRHSALQLAYQNFGKVVPKYPSETYLFAEYIEIIHAIDGHEHAIDSLNAYIQSGHQSNIFLDGYRASMLAESGKYDEAIKLAKDLEKKLPLNSYLKPNAVYADIYFQKQEYIKALPYAKKGNQLDPRNLDLSRLLSKIEKEMNE